MPIRSSTSRGDTLGRQRRTRRPPVHRPPVRLVVAVDGRRRHRRVRRRPARVNPDGSDSDGSSELYRFQGDGNQIGTFTPTYGSYSTPACPAYPPSSVRVSPDGTEDRLRHLRLRRRRVPDRAVDTRRLDQPELPEPELGQQDFWDPTWINNSRFTISHAGPPVFGAHWGEHLVTDGDNVGAGLGREPRWTTRGRGGHQPRRHGGGRLLQRRRGLPGRQAAQRRAVGVLRRRPCRPTSTPAGRHPAGDLQVHARRRRASATSTTSARASRPTAARCSGATAPAWS